MTQAALAEDMSQLTSSFAGGESQKRRHVKKQNQKPKQEQKSMKHRRGVGE